MSRSHHRISIGFHAFIYIVFAASILSGCGGGAGGLSLEEAEKVTLDYHGQNFTPPPRTIDTIVAEINGANEGSIKEQGFICRMCPSMDPNEPNPEIRMSNLSTLGIVAHHRGNSKLAAEYLQKAYELLHHPEIEKKYTGGFRSEFDHEYFAVIHRIAKVAMESGRFSDGVRYMQEALELNLKKDKPWKGKALHQYTYLAIAYANLGDVENAEDMLDDAVDMHNGMGLKNPRAVKHKKFYEQKEAMARGKVADAKGELREAEDYYRKANELLKTNIPGKKGRILTYRAEVMGSYLVENLLLQGRVAEAEAQVLDGIRFALRTFGRDNHVTAKILQSYMRVLMARGRYDDARRLVWITRNIYKTIGATGDSFELAKLHMLLASIYIAENNWEEAAKTYRYVYQTLASDPEARAGLFSGNLNWALTLSSAKDYAQASQVAQQAIEYNADVYGDDHAKTAEARGVLAMIYAQQGKLADALQLYQQIVPVFTNPRDGGYLQRYDNGSANQRLRAIMENYLQLLALRSAQGDRQAAAQAFLIAQTVQGKNVQSAVASSAARASIKDPELVRLARKEQDTTRKIEAGYNQLITNKDIAASNSGLYKTIKQRIDNLVKARDAILAEIRERFPDYDNLVRPKPIEASKVQQTLKPNEALLMFYSGREYSYVWTMVPDGRMSLHRVKLGKLQINQMVTELRKALDLQVSNISQVPEFNTTLAFQLYQQLLSSSRYLWSQAKDLIIVADGALSRLPLSVLVTQPAELHPQSLRFSEYRNVAWLARSHATSYVPSVATLVSLRTLNLQQQPQQAFAGFGNPIFGGTTTAPVSDQLATRGVKLNMRGLRRTSSGNLDKARPATSTLANLVALPETADEVLRVAGALGVTNQGNVFLGPEASEAKVKGMSLKERRVVMFATHALLPGDLDGLVQPAIALSVPKAASAGNDGLLTMSEIMGLNLNADWVVLSACNTGAGSGEGATAVSGLGQAFFYAGTRAMLISHWPVETTSAKQITTGLFDRQVADPKLSRAEALNQTLLELIGRGAYTNAQGKPVFAYAHPVFWAPFTVVGDGAGQLKTN